MKKRIVRLSELGAAHLGAMLEEMCDRPLRWSERLREYCQDLRLEAEQISSEEIRIRFDNVLEELGNRFRDALLDLAESLPEHVLADVEHDRTFVFPANEVVVQAA